jgi:hypothetical protein
VGKHGSSSACSSSLWAQHALAAPAMATHVVANRKQ